MQTLLATLIVLAAAGYLAWVWIPRKRVSVHEHGNMPAGQDSCSGCASCGTCGQ